ncbi:hypothetical protein [Methylobacterium sp. AMS5]|uniref:hypothetical protein n=1 Tax=Methylobacterium sp. AMS5 TaxID=925818 RepID=UPI00074FA9D7|nr:hypothetical protein [Methylobacterium sp. AMS5]AMB48366.1 hypothetical protein Y590_25695 [Methylobacterium sp. AMS5]
MSTETIEGAVTRAAKVGDTLNKSLTKAGASVEQVEKAFTYVALRLQAARLNAVAAAQAPATGFKLDMELPTGLLTPAPLPDRVPTYPAGARATAFTQVPQPGSRAPTRSGLTVAEIGGRMCKDARDEFERQQSSPAPAPTINGVDFIDDEDDDVSPAASADLDDGVGFVDE